MSTSRWLRWAWPAVPVAGALVVTSLLLVLFGAAPLESFQAMYDGAFGDQSKTLSVLAFWIPLLLASTGLLVTFRAGLWNIGVEGQMRPMLFDCPNWKESNVDLAKPGFRLRPAQLTEQIVARACRLFRRHLGSYSFVQRIGQVELGILPEIEIDPSSSQSTDATVCVLESGSIQGSPHVTGNVRDG